LHREVLEVLRATKEARDAGRGDEGAAKGEVEEQAERLTRATARLEELRKGLWSPDENVRVLEALA
jgi:hypothetical protein